MNHYGTLDGAKSYHQTRGNAAWGDTDKTDEQRTAALIRASSALDGVYSSKFGGRKADGRAQFLSWPREGARDYCADEDIPSDEIPIGVINAAYELALAELDSPGSSSPSITPGRVTKREKMDVIEREFFGSDDSVSADTMRPVLTAVEDALCCLIPKAGGGSVFLLRY